jgi:hypothetical protein
MTFLIGCFLFGYFRFPTAVLSRTLVLIINGVVRYLLPVVAGVGTLDQLIIGIEISDAGATFWLCAPLNYYPSASSG